MRRVSSPITAATAFSAVILLLSGCSGERVEPAESGLRTTAERTDYRETTRYVEVVDFMKQVAERDGRMHYTTFGFSHEGRAIPMVVVGADDATPEAVRESGKLRIYLQGGIHSGEVPGKESLQILLREISEGRHDTLLDSMVLLVAPLYNVDGNERVALTNRPLQHGPVGGMGQRPNAQGYDLNRDHMKLDSPEARSLTRMLTTYDPHLTVDLHTTNGTRHAYHLTYSPPLHPDTPGAIDALLRDDWLPTVAERVREARGWHFYLYGNVYPPRRGVEPGWVTFDARPRFGTNYAGLRNRFAILSEAYSYLTFRERVEATDLFVDEILRYSHAHAGAVRAAVEEADATAVPGSEIAIRSELLRSDEPVEILMGAVDTVFNPYSGAPMLLRRDVVNPVEMYEWQRFGAAETVQAPRAYLLPAGMDDIVERLRAHGAEVERLSESTEVAGEAFLVEAVQAADRPFQGHLEKTLVGRWRPATRELPAGSWRVDLEQPLGRLVVHLLEPRAEDGFANWALLDDWIEVGADYPILRVPAS